MGNSYFFTLTLFLLSLTTALQGQTSLGPGDIAFTMINTDADDAFAFVLLKDVTSGTSFDVTDREFKNGALNTGEGTIRITFTAAATCSSEFLFTSPNNDGSYSGSRVQGTGAASSTNVDGSMTLSTGGDGLIAFRGSTFITALQKCGGGFGTDDSQCSDLPTGLTAGVNALAYTNNLTGDPSEPDNIKYACSPTSGTPAQLSTFIATNGNWLENDAAEFDYGSGCGFTCLAACIDPTISSVVPSLNNACPTVPVTLTINGSLGNASQWELRQGGCNSPVIATTTGNTFTVNPGLTTTYAITANDCNSNQICQSVTVSRSTQAANAGTDQLLVSGTSTNLMGSNPGTASGSWSIISGDGNGSFNTTSANNAVFSGAAGQSYVLRWSVSGGGCPASSDEVEVSFSAANDNLMPGDVAFTGYNSDDPDEWSFVVLTDIPAGTDLFFTDNGWLINNTFRTGEGILKLTFARAYACGSSIIVTRNSTLEPYRAEDETGASAAFAVTVTENGNVAPTLSTTGDQLFAYQGSLATPRLLAGIMVNGAWGAGSVDNGFSTQPPALTGNNTSVNVSADTDNAKYNCAVSGGVPIEIRTAVNTVGNWNTSETLLDLTATCNFECGVCEEPVITNVAVDLDPVCQGTPVTLTVTGTLNGATRWAVYETNCGVDLVTTSTTNTLTFNPDVTRTYYVAGIDGCVATPNCTLVPINVTGNAADVAPDQIITPDGQTFATIQPFPPTDGQVATLEFLTGDGLGTVSGPTGSNVWTINGTAGQAYTLRYSHSGSSCPTTTDDVRVVYSNPTDLATGDIAFTGINTDAPDGFSFVALRDIDAGTTITFTDRGWNGGFLANGESTMQLRLLSPLACGEGAYLTAGATNDIIDWTARIVGSTEIAGDLTQIGSVAFFTISTSGDQVFAYQGAEPTGESSAQNADNFLAGISTNISSAGTTNEDWDNQIASLSGDSDLPSVLSGFAVLISDATGSNTNEVNNGQYNCTLSGNTNADASFINDWQNWSTSSSSNFDLSQSCILPCDPPPVAICQDITVEIDATSMPTTNGQPFTASDLDGGSTDNGSIDPDGFSVDIIPGCSNITAPPSPTTIKLTVTDDLGQTSTCTSQVTVEDNVAPTADCNNIVVDLPASGNLIFFEGGVQLQAIAGNFQDNCAPSFTATGLSFGTANCSTLGLNENHLFGFRDGNGQEATCFPITIQVNDPLGICGSDPVANCQDFTAELDGTGTYVLDANSLDNGSTDDRSVYSLVFSDATDRQESLTADCTFEGDGQGQSFTAGQDGVVQTIRVRSVTSVSSTIHLYAGDNGSGIAGSVGTPLYSQPVELFASVEGAFTEILLTTPFPVTNGEEYSFILEGITNLHYACFDSPEYPNGRSQINYIQFANDLTQDYTFQVDIIGPTTQAFTTPGVFPTTVYAVDDRGNVSPACTADFTLEACQPGAITSINVNNNDICPGEAVTITWSGGLDGSTEWTVYSGSCGGDFVTTTLGNSVMTMPAASTTYFVRAEGGCAATECGGISVDVTVDETPPVVVTRDIVRNLDENNTLSITPEEVFDEVASSDNCDAPGRGASTSVMPISVTPNMFTDADIGENTVTLTAEDGNGNTSTATAIVTVEAQLPVSWLYFSAAAGAKQVDLNWGTSLEPENAGFHVERSPGALVWTVISEIAASTAADQDYELTDRQPLSGLSYYRVRQTDFDGTVTYSPVRSVVFSGDKKGILLLPNPATDVLTVRLPEGATILSMVDVAGRSVATPFTARADGMQANVRQLRPGLYLLRVQLADGQMVVRRVVVKR